MSIEALIFDLDGVIASTDELHYQAWKQLADELGIPFTHTNNDKLRGVPRDKCLDCLLGGRLVSREVAHQLMERKNTYYQNLLATTEPENLLLEGVEPLLEKALASGLRLGIGSASKNARNVLNRLKLTDIFHAIADGYTVLNLKPAPDIFIWVAGRLDVSPAQAIVFEDAEAGIESALTGGFWTIGIGSANVAKAHLLVSGLGSLSIKNILAQFNAKALAKQNES